MNIISVYQRSLEKPGRGQPGLNVAMVPSPHVRREYLKLPDDLAALTRGFGIDLPPLLRADAAVLAFSIECADRLLDAIPQAARRERFSHDILACLRGEVFSNEDLTAELAGWLSQLKEVAQRHGVEDQFHSIVHALLKNSERMRTTRSEERFVVYALKEGHLMVELLLLILRGRVTEEFGLFMRQLAAPANLGDKLRDARGDFRRGEMAFRPSLFFRARLVCEICWRSIRLLRFPAMNWRLLYWGIQSIFTEFIWFPFSKSHSH
jgi:hypothetical protein